MFNYAPNAQKDAPCPHFNVCGGCAYQDISYEEELAVKEKGCLNALKEAGFADFEYIGITPSPVARGYKNKMDYSFGDFEKGGPLELGLHKKRNFYACLTPEHCNIADGDFTRIVLAVRDFFRETGEAFYHKKTREGTLRNLIIRKSAHSGEIMVNLVATGSLNLNEEAFCRAVLSLNTQGRVASIIKTVNDVAHDGLEPVRADVLYGKSRIIERVNDKDFIISPFAFFQTNSFCAERMAEAARGFCAGINARTVADFFCGSGFHALCLADLAESAVGFDVSAEAVLCANENASLNRAGNCAFFRADLSQKAPRVLLPGGREAPLAEALPFQKAELLILDPPREGLRPKFFEAVPPLCGAHIIYISCNVKTLARDLRLFAERGVKIKKAALCDMFPRTAHTEVLCLLERVM